MTLRLCPVPARLSATMSALMLLAACARSPNEGRLPPSPSTSGSPGEAPARAVGAGDPSRSVLRVDPWPFEPGVTGRVIRTPNYAIYTTETEPIITDRLPGFMEAALPHYAGAVAPLGRPAPGAALEIFVMASRPQWERLTLRMLGGAGVSVTNAIERGGFTTGGRAFLFDIGAADTFSIAAHEGWHQFSQTTLRERLPLWLEEGLATFCEGHRWIGNDVVFLPWCNLERFDRLRDAAARGGLLGLRELLAAGPQTFMNPSGAGASAGGGGPLTYYAQAWALVHFLREGQGGRHRAGLEQLVADAARGTMARAIAQSAADQRARPLALPDALTAGVVRTYFGGDLDALARGYDEFLREVLRTGARGDIVEGRSPLRGR